MVVIDHVTVRGGVWAAARRRGTPLVLDPMPGVAQCFGEVVVHRASDGHGVGGGGLRLLVVLPQTAAEVLLDHRVAGCIGWRRRQQSLFPTSKKKKKDLNISNTCIKFSGGFIA